MSYIISDIQLAADLLIQDKIVAIPTETVYGLAANAYSKSAVAKVFQLKNRPTTHPLIVHIKKDEDLNLFAHSIPPYVTTLIDTFWPGPLTIILPAHFQHISTDVTGGQDSVALRSPKHRVTQDLLNRLSFPLVAPSANPFTKISPTTAEHVLTSFSTAEISILEGGRCELGIESTIVLAINTEKYQILRFGSIHAATIKAALPGYECVSNYNKPAPGSHAQHYQPNKKVYAFKKIPNLISFCKEHTNSYILTRTSIIESADNFHQRMPSSATELSYELYYQLRCADASAAERIVLELPPDTEEYAAIHERLVKAATIIE